MGLNKRLIGAGATGSGELVPSENFKAVTYNGNGTTNYIDVGFKPDLVWIKRRNASASHALFDSTRGREYILYPDDTSASAGPIAANRDIKSFDNNGFTLSIDSYGNVNTIGNTYVAWCWKANGGTTSSNTDGTITSTVQANQDAGFSIVTATAPSSGVFTVGHGLNAEIDLYIIKNTSSTGGWITYVRDLGADKYLELHSNSAAGTSVNFWNNTNPTSSVFTMNAGYVITGSSNFIAYCFKSIDGFSKFGTYTGNGTTEGPIVETGFEPAFIIIKDVDGTDNWAMVDNKRATTNPRQTWLRANLTNAEFSNTVDSINFYSNGFQIAGGTSVSNFLNESGNTFIYMAFAADPDTEQPTLAKSFSTVTYTGTGSSQAITGLGFAPNLVWVKQRGGTTWHNIQDTINGATKHLYTNATNALDTTSNGLTSFDSDGFTLGGGNGFNGSSQSMVAWAWKADDNEPTIFPEVGKKVSITQGSSNYFVLNTTSASGKYYWEVKILSHEVACTAMIGLYTSGYKDGWQNTRSRSYYGANGQRYKGTTSYNYGSSYTTGDVIGIAFNGDDDQITFYKNGTSQGVAFTTTEADSNFGIQLSTGLYAYTAEIRFTSSEWDYSAPSGFDEWTASKTAYDTNDITGSGGGFEYDNNASIVSANANAGFSIVKWEGAGGTSKIPHGLSAAPELIINKRLSGSNSWDFWVTGATAIGWDKFLGLNRTDAAANGFNNTPFGDTAPTSTVFTVNSDSGAGIGGSGDEFISYCFHSVSGYSKIGSYTGNGAASGTVVEPGFAPDFVMVKRTDGTSNWGMFDSERSGTYYQKGLIANLSDAEYAETNVNSACEFLAAGHAAASSGGFRFRDSSSPYNVNSGTYIYMAFKMN